MANFIRTTMHPERYHGYGKRPPFFEGWYFKLVDATEQHRYAIIPGVFLSGPREQHHAFVQVLDGNAGASAYYTYPLADFHADNDDFVITIGPNHFSRERLTVQLEGEEIAVRGDLRFTGSTPWPVSITAPGIMGWYAWIPSMECYHGVVSLDHAINGALAIDGKQANFTGGRGYIEKDWGQSFPSAWVWMQTNHFAQPGTCFTGSIAMIPWVGHAFRGFIIGLWHDQSLYRFATYTGATTEKLAITDAAVEWVVRDHKYRLEMHAIRATGGLLHEPSRVEMHKRVMETLQSSIEVRMARRSDGNVIFHGTGHNAGLEVQNALEKLTQ